MYYNILKTIKNRNNFSKNIKKIWFFNTIKKDNNLIFDVFEYNKLKINNVSITKIRNRCIMNGKSRSVFSKFRLSRFYMKSLSRNGSLAGILKK